MTEINQNKTVKIQQIASPIRRHKNQALHLKGLGLSKMNNIVELEDTDSVRGLIKKVAHMVKIIQN